MNDEKRVVHVTEWHLKSSPRADTDHESLSRRSPSVTALRQDNPLMEAHISIFAPEAEEENSTRWGVATHLLNMVEGKVDFTESAYLLNALEEQIHALRRRLDDGRLEALVVPLQQTCMFCEQPGELARPLVTGPGLLSPAICSECVALASETLMAGGNEVNPDDLWIAGEKLA